MGGKQQSRAGDQSNNRFDRNIKIVFSQQRIFMRFAAVDVRSTDTTILEISIAIGDDNPLEIIYPTFHAYINSRPKGDAKSLYQIADVIKIIAENTHPDIQTDQHAYHNIQYFLSQHQPKAFVAKDNYTLKTFFDRYQSKERDTIDFKTAFLQTGDDSLPNLETCLKRAKLDNCITNSMSKCQAVVRLVRTVLKLSPNPQMFVLHQDHYNQLRQNIIDGHQFEYHCDTVHWLRDIQILIDNIAQTTATITRPAFFVNRVQDHNLQGYQGSQGTNGSITH